MKCKLKEMMGYGSSSNLSPLAPPFTVDRSVSNPLVDLTEPVNTYGVSMNNTSLHNWVSGSTNPSNSAHDYFSILNPEYEPLVSETQYIYSPSSLSTANYNCQHHHVPPVNVKAPSHLTSFVKGNAYYPSYVSPTIAEESNPVVSHQSGYDLLSSARVPVSSGESSAGAYAQGVQHSVVPCGGLWEGMAAWQQSNPAGGVFCSNNNVAKQGLYSSNYRSKYDGGSHATNVFGSVKHSEAANSGQMDYKSYRDKSSDLVSADYPAGSSLSTSPDPVTFPHASLKAIDSRSPLKWDSCLNDGVQVMKPSPGVVIRMPEEKHPYSVERLCTGKELNNDNFLRNNPSIMKEANAYTGFVGKVCLDNKDTGFHLKQSEQLESRKCVSGDDLDQLSCAKLRIQGPNLSVYAFHASADDSTTINSVDNSSSNNLDHHNPALDSPCWKGAPSSHKSPFEVSDPALKQDIRRSEASRQPDFQGHQIPPSSASIILDFSPEKPNENFVHAGDGISENSLAYPKYPISREELVEKPEFTGAFAGYSQRMEIRDDICELSEEYAGKLIDNSDLKIPLTEQQNPEEAKYSFGKSCASRNDVADVGISLNDDSDDCSSQVPYDAIENVLCSPPSAENVNNAVNRSHSGASAPKTCIHTMLNTMQNLSELLLFSFSNDKNDLKEEDYETLESIINNLDMCVLKNVEMMTSMPASFNLHRANSQPFTSRVHKDVNENSIQAPQVSAIGHHVVSGKEHNTLSSKEDVCHPVRTSAEIGEDKTTQAIKNILDRNFHDVEQTHEQALLYKNLWLEAEALLCSVNYIARFNRMKMEMEKQKEDDKPPNIVLKPNLISSDTKAGKITEVSVPYFSPVSTRIHADDGLAQILGDLTCKTNCLKTSAGQKVSISNISADHISEELVSTSNKRATPDATLQHSCGQIKTSHVNDVTTSFLNLKNYDSKSSSVDGSAAEQLSGFNYLLDPIKVSKTTSASNKEAKSGIPKEDISVAITTSHVDDVIARYHILKNQIENSNSLDKLALEKSSSSMDSSELSNVDKLSHDKSGLNKNTSIQDFYMGNSVPHADDVTARFQVLTSCAEKLKSADTSVVENLSSSSVLLDPVNADKVENDAKDLVKRDTSVKNSVPSGTTSHIDDEEGFFMARNQILKQRVDNSGSMHKKIHQPDQFNLGYTGQRMHWPNCEDEIWDRTLNVNVDPLLQTDASKHGLQQSTGKEYLLFSRGNHMAQSECSMSNRIEDQPLAGCYDNGSSDWEHVLKEELTGQNS